MRAGRWVGFIALAGSALGLPWSHKQDHADNPHIDAETPGARANVFQTVLAALSTGARRIVGRGSSTVPSPTVRAKGRFIPPSKST